jgi:hypothetical protein
LDWAVIRKSLAVIRAADVVGVWLVAAAFITIAMIRIEAIAVGATV